MKPLYEAHRAGATIFQSETLGAFWQRSRVYVKSAIHLRLSAWMDKRRISVL
jgi:hypothetical protein